jgi:hypothetical protein
MRVGRSLIAISAGVALALVISVLLSLLSPFYLIPIYNHFVAAGGASATFWTAGTAHLSPSLSISIALLTSVMQIGPPAFLAAWVARNRFILHAVATAAVYLSVSALLSWDVVKWSPLYFVAISAWSILVAAISGGIRGLQTLNVR